jgi:uncharacterized protein YfaS (alpha-2-macroglobulin family)
MQKLLQAVWVLWGALVVVVGLSGIAVAESQVTRLEGIDLPGFDYDIRKNVDLEACEAACVGDRICRAYTFNENAGWCFLKGSSAAEQPFKGAVSGKVSPVPSPAVTAAVRQAEIPFPSQGIVDSARYFASTLPTSDAAPANVGYADLIASGDLAIEQRNLAAAIVPYRQALGINGNDPALWFKLARAQIDRAEATAGQSESYDLSVTATYSAVNGLLLADGRGERAEALSLLARALERREMWSQSIATYRASIALVDDADLVARLDKVVAEHGFRVVSTQVDSEAATPRICAVFSEGLPGGETDMSQYVVVADAPQVAVETADSQVCLTGVDFGKRYAIKLRSGLPSANGETLRADVDLNVFVPDRSPFVGFANTAYVMPARLGGGLPITSVNAETAEVVIYRIGDRSIATAVRNGLFQRTLDGYSAEEVANQSGEQVWAGEVDLAAAAANVMTTTAIPVSEVLAHRQPGAYVITAKVKGSNQDYWREMATQWFIVTDLGLTEVRGEDGLHAFVRSLSDAQPVADATVRLVAVNNEILGEMRTDADGRADFAPGLARGEGGRAPQLLVVETDAGDYAFLNIDRPGFDLTDRGVEGRPSPGPLDVFTTTERGVYRPGEFVFVTSLVRDGKAQAVPDLAMTMRVERPDGVVAETSVLQDQGAGSYFAEIALPADAMRGSWRVTFHADPQESALSSTSFLVQDFEPERLAFAVRADDVPLVPGEVTAVDVTASYLYGATAPGLAIEADAIIRPLQALADFPGYVFGREDDETQSQFEPLGVVGVTDEAGNAVAEIVLPEPEYSTRPMEARVNLRLIDSNGRAIQRSIVRPVLADTVRLGIKPAFEDATSLGDGSEASFDVIAVAPNGEMVASEGLNWRLSRIETNYQWYRSSGVWRWEAVVTSREVANGAIDTAADAPSPISAPVNWGRYLLEIDGSGDAASATSYSFYAGYYYPEAGSDTPDTLKVALDKPAYRAGETAIVQLEPQFAGTALVMVVDDALIDIRSVEVPAEGLSVELPVTEAWGPGAYVTAILYRPADAAEKRMPARALGLAYADVDPGEMLLGVDLEVPEVNPPRAALEVKVRLDGARAGDTAYVAVAAVDLGILNLTGFATPDPDGWYFGQRQLGVEFRDLYGQLIDPTQGLPGAMRSGGDGSGGGNGTPPPTTVLVAQHSGIVEVGADGTATVSFDMPDFNGTVRLMAMAWTAAAVGHAEKDVIVRDPVVVNLSPPRFLRLDDTSRLLVEVNNVGGQSGDYTVELVTGAGLSSTAAKTTRTLAVGERMALDLDLTATALGDNALKVLVTGPGTTLIKELTLGVRAASGPRTVSQLLPIGPGETVTVDRSMVEGLIPHSGELTLAIGPVARLDVPSLLLGLDRYPYGCAEQVSSRAFPLLYLNEVAQRIGMGGDEAIDKRVEEAIANLLSKQNSSGSFGLWGPFGASDLWLDSYVTDFLLQAKAEGYDVPELALSRALDSLGNQVSYASDFSSGGEDIAYALYDLARAGRAAIGDLRYYLEAKLAAFSTPLAKAQLGAALALYGDRARAQEAFEAAVATLDGWKEDRTSYRSDYGSKLRDSAAVLALAAEFAPSGIDLAALAKDLADLRDANRYTSTQEDAWTLIAAAALARETADGSVRVDGEVLSGSIYLHYTQDQIEAADVTVTNKGNRPTEAKVSVSGIPAVPPPASTAGFGIERAYFTPSGEPITLDQVAQNDRFVVVLTTRPAALGSGQYMVADPLPAGFEIENPDLLQGSGVADLAWLTVDRPVHFEARTDQYIAAFRFTALPQSVTTAYLVRAVSPGSFVLPGATVEDMYRPEFRGNTETGQIEIAAAGP